MNYADGLQTWNGEYHTISLNSKKGLDYLTEILMHEWGHILQRKNDKDDHGKEWGMKYSLIYNAFLEWMEKSYQ